MAIITKAVPVEAHWSIEIVERFHPVLKRTYKVIMKNLTIDAKVSKEVRLQMTVKAVNDTAEANGLVPTLLVFGAYSRMHHLDPPAPNIIQRAATISKAMGEVRKMMTKRQVRDALNSKNGPIVSHLHDLPINSEVLVWREGNADKSGNWTGPFKMLGIEDETCKIAMPYGTTDFRSTVVKPFFTNESENVTNVRNEENTDRVNEEISENGDTGEISQPQGEDEEAPSPNSFRTPETPIKRGRDRPRKLPLRYKNSEADISIFLQSDFQNDQLLMQHMQDPAPGPFVESRKKEINGLFEKGCFEIVSASDVPHGTRIFNSRFVDEIKNIGTVDAYEKSRLVVQAYNDDGKAEVLTQAPTIQRMSQRLILALVVSMPHLGLFLRDIFQAYVQSTISLARQFFIRPPIELGLREGTVLKIIKSLYEVPEAGAHWFNTYHRHHTEKLAMQQSTYDPCLLYTNKKGFGVVGLQIDDTLILRNETFANAENVHLHEAKLLAKEKEKLTSQHPIKFNGAHIKQENSQLKNPQSLYLNQERLCKNLRLVTPQPSDLTSARGVIRKSVTFGDQYVAQRARGAYIATLSQPEAAFDLSFVAQVIAPKQEDAKRLNKRIQWQLDNCERGLRFIKLDTTSLKLIAFTDAAFANNSDYTSQIGFVICLTDGSNKANLIHWSSIKCKRVTRSVLAAELFAMAQKFDVASMLKSTIEKMLQISLPMVICTDSKSLYDCLVRLGSTIEKRLMVDIMCFRESYERKKIAEIQ